MQIDISHVIGQLETACNQAGSLEVTSQVELVFDLA